MDLYVTFYAPNEDVSALKKATHDLIANIHCGRNTYSKPRSCDA